MIIKGLDNGYLYTKDNEMRLFKSAYSRTDMSLTDKSKIIINGDNYYFGKGNTTADADKSDNKVTEVSILANLAMTFVTTGDNEYCIVGGLPIAQYKEHKGKFRDAIMRYNNSEVIYDNKLFKPHIREVDIFAQGVGALFNIGLPDGEYISFDVGSYTINVILIEIINGMPHIIKFDTWYDGILTLYSKIIFEVNRKFNVTLDIDYAEKIISRGRLVVNGENKNLDFIKLIMSDYLDNILTKFKPNYPYSTETIVFSGGGSNLLSDMFRFDNSIILPDSQFANATGYYNFGIQKYGNLVERGYKYA